MICLAAACAGERSASLPSPTIYPTYYSKDVLPATPTPDWPVPSGTPTLDPPRAIASLGVITVTYVVRRGDTLSGIAYATSTTPEELQQVNGLRNPDALRVGQILLIRRQVVGRTPALKLIPDSELVNGPTAVAFDTARFVSQQDGYLNRYSEVISGKRFTGAQIVQRVAERFSVHPRLLLAALEHVGGWVTQHAPTDEQQRSPLGYIGMDRPSLYLQLSWAAARLNEGYYGWRLATRGYVRLNDGNYLAIAEGVNAGTAGLHNYLAAISTAADWPAIAEADGARAFMRTYRRLFGDPWRYEFGPLVPSGLEQPPLALPWRKGELWYFTGGPHSAWGSGTPWGALDFAPASVAGCTPLRDWVTAVADGVVARSADGEVVLSLDPSGDERVGWSVLYLHIASRNRPPAGARVKAGDLIGHPSCEGGFAVAAHLHLARKYNGEWLNAQGNPPFVLEGWMAIEGKREYDGALVKGDQRREACECKQPNYNGITR